MVMINQLASQTSCVLFTFSLQVVKRQGWIRHDVRDPESSKHLSVWNESRTMEKSSPPYDTVSDHMYRMACACMLIEDDNVDKNK